LGCTKKVLATEEPIEELKEESEEEKDGLESEKEKMDEELKKNTIQLIDTIENAEEFPTNPSKLCEWCKFKSICSY